MHPSSSLTNGLNSEQICRRQPTSLPKSTILSKFLQQGPTIKLLDIPPKQSGKVLTSTENLKAIEKKEKKKLKGQ